MKILDYAIEHARRRNAVGTIFPRKPRAVLVLPSGEGAIEIGDQCRADGYEGIGVLTGWDAASVQLRIDGRGVTCALAAVHPVAPSGERA